MSVTYAVNFDDDVASRLATVCKVNGVTPKNYIEDCFSRACRRDKDGDGKAMLERVARRLYDGPNGIMNDVPLWEAIEPESRTFFRAMADVCIREMLEATPRMIQQGCDAFWDQAGEKEEVNVRRGWMAMIHAALEGEMI